MGNSYSQQRHGFRPRHADELSPNSIPNITATATATATATTTTTTTAITAVATTTLPVELILLILEAAYCQNDTSPRERRQGLCAAALVSLAWIHPAQHLLWRSIEVKDVVQIKALRRVCEWKGRGMELAVLTRKLSVSRRTGDPPAWAPTMKDIARVLKRLPHVEELHLDQPPAELPLFASFDFQLAATRRPDVPKLTTLRISFARPSLVHNLLHILPSLRFVAVQSSLSPEAAGDDERPPSSLTPRCRLYELRWGVTSSVHITQALRSSANTLRILALHSLPPEFASLMQSHGKHLRSLRVFRYNPSLPKAVSHCPALEEFIMQDHVPPAELLQALPPTLEHLAIDTDYGHQRGGLRAVAAWVIGRRHSPLRVVTCFSPDYGDKDWSRLVRACAESGVELRCFKGWHGTYEDEFEDLGEVHTFPRSVPYHEQRVLPLNLESRSV